MLEVADLGHDYGAHPALSKVSFTVAERELVCIVGPSGCGKSTLLRAIAGLLRPTAGEVWLHGHRVDGVPSELAVVFQDYSRSLFPWLTVEQNVELPLKEKRIGKAERRRLVDTALDAVGLADVPRSYPWQLSGGMQQRVAIARAIAYEPHVLLMDEPFAAVDAQTRADLEDLVRDLWHRFKVTTLFVTHDIDESVYLAQRVIVLSSSPTVIRDDVTIDLPEERDQLHTRSSPRFAELRARVFEQIHRPKEETPGGVDPHAPAVIGTGSSASGVTA